MSDPQDDGPTVPGPDDALLPGDQPTAAPGGNSAARSVGRYQVGDGDDRRRPVRDRLLDRAVTGRVTSLSGADELEHEARFLARLDHAGTPAILDFVRGDAGAMLVERTLDGPTLAEAIVRARLGEAVPGIETPAAVLLTMLKVCDAVGAAHARGVVHHGLRPEGIRLGGHGQVVVEDWSAAMAARLHPATLRFVSGARPSQETALDGLHADIRAIGSCLLAALALRRPSTDGGGQSEPITPDERLRVPPQIEAVARLAMRSDPTQGYRDVGELAADLRRCADGMAPTAYAPGPLARSVAWMRRHRRMMWSGLGLVVVAAAIAAVPVWPSLRAAYGWSTVAQEGFSDATWRERWCEPPGQGPMFEARDGRLVSVADRDAFLIFRRRLTTPAAIEYTGEILPGSQPCDLSVQWSENDGVAGDPARFGREGRGYMVQAGAFGNAFCAIYQNPGRRLMAHANRQLEPGRRYRFRVDIGGTRIAMSIDGVQVLEAEDVFPTASGFISLYGFYPGKAFDDVRVLERLPANPPTRLDAGDEAFHAGRYGAAAGQYRRVVETGPASADGQGAMFRLGLAEWYLGHADQAAATWASLTDPALVDRVADIGVEPSSGTDQRHARPSWLEERYAAQPAQREDLRGHWRRIVQQQLEAPKRNLVAIEYLLGMQRRLFPDDPSCRFVAATTLIALQRYAEVLSAYPEQRHPCARAMLALGRTHELVSLPWVGNDERIHALGMRGEFDQVLSTAGAMPVWRTRTLIRLDRQDEALRLTDSAYPVLLFMGRGAELLEEAGRDPVEVTDALVSLGRLREAAGSGLPHVAGSGGSVTAMLLLGQVDLAERVGGVPRHAIRFMMALERGDDAASLALRDHLALPADLAGSYGWFAPVMLLPFTDHQRGDPQALARLRAQLPLLDGIYARSAWFVARTVLGDAGPDGAAGMPARYEAPAWSRLAEGMRAEIEGRTVDARASYAAFRDLPLHRRLLDGNRPDVDVEWFVSWRLRALGGKP